jgi:hypothetical protein
MVNQKAVDRLTVVYGDISIGTTSVDAYDGTFPSHGTPSAL